MNRFLSRITAVAALILCVALLGTQFCSAETELPSIDIDTSPVTNIVLGSAPKKLSYFVGEDIDVTGATIIVTRENGKKETVSVRRDWCGDVNNITDGKVKVYVEYPQRGLYTGESPSFTVSFTTPAVSSLTITKEPRKLTYYTGEKLETTGMEVTAAYSNGESWDVTNEVKLTGFQSDKPGKQEITVSYTINGKTYKTSFTVNVHELGVVSAELMRQPERVQYIEGEVFSLSGAVLQILYNDGHTETIENPEEIAVDGYDPLRLGKQDIYLSCKGVSTVLTVEVMKSPTHKHTLGEYLIVQQPSCTEPGTRISYCTVCGELAQSEVIPPLGHTFAEITIIKEPTLEEEGQYEFICLVCSSCIQDSIPRLQTESTDGPVTIRKSAAGSSALVPFAGSIAVKCIENTEIPEESSAIYGTFGSWTDSYGNEYRIELRSLLTVTFFDGEQQAPLAEDYVCSVNTGGLSAIYVLRFSDGTEVRAENAAAVFRVTEELRSGFEAALVEYIPVNISGNDKDEPEGSGAEKLGRILLIGAAGIAAVSIAAVVTALLLKKRNNDMLH